MLLERRFLAAFLCLLSFLDHSLLFKRDVLMLIDDMSPHLLLLFVVCSTSSRGNSQMRAIVNKIVAKGQSDASKAPTLSTLLQPRISRNFSREIEEWLVTHDIVTLLEGLTSHLLRTLPHDEIEETDKWLDGKKVSKSATAAVMQDDVTITADGQGWNYADRLIMEGVWQNQPVSCVVVKRHPTLLHGGASTKAHQHCVACLTATAPQICSVTHEGVLPTYGYWNTDESIGLLHPRVPPECCVQHQLKKWRGHLTAGWILRVAHDVLSGLGHLHTLGYLHRNVGVECVFELHPGQFVVGGFDYTIRSSRGRITAPSWAPRVPAPEVLHTRTFETSTDVFAFGVMVLEMCSYGSPVVLPLPTARPAHIPTSLWSIVLPCLNVSRDARPTCHHVLGQVRELLRDHSHKQSLIPHPSERVAAVSTEFLTRLGDTGCSPDMVCTEHVVVENIRVADWSVVEDALHRSTVLTSLSLRNCEIDGSALQPLPKRPLTQLIVDDVRTVAMGVDNDSKSAVFLHRQLREYLVVSGVSLTTLHLTKLETHPTEKVCSLLDALPTWTPQLMHLGLTNMQLQSDAIRSLGEALEREGQWQKLNSITLGRGDLLSSHGMGSLCCALLRDSRVQRLTLDGAVIDYFGIGQLGQLIRATTGIEEISLKDVNMSECGRRVIDAAVRQATSSTLRVVFCPV